jgi:hypothetical protein
MLGNRRRSGRLFARDLTPSVDGRPKVSRRCTTELWPRFSQAQKACLRRLAYFANGLHSRGGGNRARANKIVLKPVDAPATKTKKTQTSRLFSKTASGEADVFDLSLESPVQNSVRAIPNFSYAVSLLGTACHQSRISFCRPWTCTERSENGLSFAGITASILATAFAPSHASSSPLNR